MRLACPGSGRLTNLVVDAERLVGMLDKLVNRESGIVRLNDGIRNLGRRHDRKRGQHAIREFLADLGLEERTHASASAAAEGVRDLEPL